MVIAEEIYNKIISTFAAADIEAGGILGEKGGVICAFHFDGMAVCDIGEYIPDVDGLNKVIKDWANKNIAFAGLIHSHDNGQALLSPQDKNYAKDIFEANGAVKLLYFPVVIYKNGEPKIVGYKYNGAWIEDKITII